MQKTTSNISSTNSHSTIRKGDRTPANEHVEISSGEGLEDIQNSDGDGRIEECNQVIINQSRKRRRDSDQDEHQRPTLKSAHNSQQRPSSASAPESSTMARPSDLTPDHSQEFVIRARKILIDTFKYLILEGPAIFSERQAFLRMAETARGLLADEPDMEIYEIELEEKLLQLSRSEIGIETKISKLVEPILDILSKLLNDRSDHALQTRVDVSITKQAEIAKEHSDKLSDHHARLIRQETRLTTPDQHSLELVQLQIELEKTQNQLKNLAHDLERSKREIELGRRSEKERIERAVHEHLKTFRSDMKDRLASFDRQWQRTFTSHGDRFNKLEDKFLQWEDYQKKKREPSRRLSDADQQSVLTKMESLEKKMNQRLEEEENNRRAFWRDVRHKISRERLSVGDHPHENLRHNSTPPDRSPQPRTTTLDPNMGNHARPRDHRNPTKQPLLTPTTQGPHSNSGDTVVSSTSTSRKLTIDTSSETCKNKESEASNTPTRSSVTPLETNARELTAREHNQIYNNFSTRIMHSNWFNEFVRVKTFEHLTKHQDENNLRPTIEKFVLDQLDRLGFNSISFLDIVKLFNQLMRLNVNDYLKINDPRFIEVLEIVKGDKDLTQVSRLQKKCEDLEKFIKEFLADDSQVGDRVRLMEEKLSYTIPKVTQGQVECIELGNNPMEKKMIMDWIEKQLLIKMNKSLKEIQPIPKKVNRKDPRKLTEAAEEEGEKDSDNEWNKIMEKIKNEIKKFKGEIEKDQTQKIIKLQERLDSLLTSLTPISQIFKGLG